MSTESFTHFVFVDFENVPVIDLSGIKGQPMHVTLLIGKKQTKIDLKLVEQIKEFAVQIDLVTVGKSGRNALDLTLSCHLGRAIERNPKARFSIVSKDKDFDPLVAHLVERHVNVARRESFAALSLTAAAKRSAAAKSLPVATLEPVPLTRLESRYAKVIALLKDPANRNRPTTETALRAHIKNALGKDSTDDNAEEVIRRLRHQQALAIGPHGKVVYSA